MVFGFMAPNPDNRIKWCIPSRTDGDTVVSTNPLIFSRSIKSTQAVCSAVVVMESGSVTDPILTCPSLLKRIF